MDQDQSLYNIAELGVKSNVLQWSFLTPPYCPAEMIRTTYKCLKRDYNHIPMIQDELEPKFAVELEVRYGNMIIALSDYFDTYGSDREDIRLIKKLNTLYNHITYSYHQK